MLQGLKWQEFLHSGVNKEQLINIIKDYILQNCRYDFPAKSKTYQVTATDIEELTTGAVAERLRLSFS